MISRCPLFDIQHLEPVKRKMARIRSPHGFAAVVSLLATAVSAKDVGYYDSKQCIDPSGFEKCYESAEQSWTDCVNSNCDGSNDVNCNNACRCVQALNQIDCAGQSCWNQVGSSSGYVGVKGVANP